MQRLLALAILLLANPVIAADLLTYDDGGDIATIEVAGKGTHVCVAEDRATDMPLAARANSYKKASDLAIKSCVARQKKEKRTVDKSECEIKGCEIDPSANAETKTVMVVRREANASGASAAKGPWRCYSDGMNNLHVGAGRASTKSEAMMAAQLLCMEVVAFQNTMFCDPRPTDCRDERIATGDLKVKQLKAKVSETFWELSAKAADALAAKLNLRK
jgi:hypothetical protein